MLLKKILRYIEFCFPLLLSLYDLIMMILNVEQWQCSLFSGLLLIFQTYLYVLQIKSDRHIQLVENEQYVCMMFQMVWSVYFLQNYLTKEQIVVLICQVKYVTYHRSFDQQQEIIRGEHTALIELLFTFVMIIFIIFSEIKKPSITAFIFMVLIYSGKFKKVQDIETELPPTTNSPREKIKIPFDLVKQFNFNGTITKFDIIQDNYKFDQLKVFTTIDQLLTNLKVSWNDNQNENVNVVTLSQPSVSVLTNMVQQELSDSKQDNTVFSRRPNGIESIPLVFSNFSKQGPLIKIQTTSSKLDPKKDLFERINEYQSVYNFKSDCDNLLGHVQTENGQIIYYLLYIHSEIRCANGNTDVTLQISNSLSIPFHDDTKYTILEHFFLVQSRQCQVSYKNLYRRFKRNQKVGVLDKLRSQMNSLNKSIDLKDFQGDLDNIQSKNEQLYDEVQIIQDIQMCSLLMLMVNQNFNVYDLLKPGQPIKTKKFNFLHTLENITLLLQFHPDYLKNNIHFQIKDSYLQISIINDERKVKQFFINLFCFIMLLKDNSQKKPTKININLKEGKDSVIVQIVVPEVTYPQEFMNFNQKDSFNPVTILNVVKFYFYATLNFSTQIGSSLRIKYPKQANGLLKIIVKLYSQEQDKQNMEVNFESQEDIIEEEVKQWSEILYDNN